MPGVIDISLPLMMLMNTINLLYTTFRATSCSRTCSGTLGFDRRCKYTIAYSLGSRIRQNVESGMWPRAECRTQGVGRSFFPSREASKTHVSSIAYLAPTRQWSLSARSHSRTIQPVNPGGSLAMACIRKCAILEICLELALTLWGSTGRSQIVGSWFV